MPKEASSICRRNDNADKQPSHSLSHLHTGPVPTMYEPCIPETLFHADDHIISSISPNQGDMSIRKQTHHRHLILLPFLPPLCHSPSINQSLSLCFSFYFYIPPSFPFSVTNPHLFPLPLSFRVAEK